MRTDLSKFLETDAALLGLVSNDNENIFYFTGFHGIDPLTAVVTHDKAFLLVSKTDADQAKLQVRKSVEVLEYGKENTPAVAIAQALKGENCKTIGLPPYAWALFNYFKEVGLKTKPLIINPVKKCRVTKDESEIAALKQVQLISERLTEETIEAINDNSSTGKVKNQIRGIADSMGTYFPFSQSFILSSGVSTIFPHDFGKDSVVLPANEPIIIDMVPRSRETLYCGNYTRTVFNGKPSAEVAEAYQTIVDVSEELYRRLAPGMEVKEVLKFGSNALRARIGFRQKHALGHGVGLQYHEDPLFAEGYDGKLEKGTVFTLEVGLYRDRGVRVGNMFVMSDRAEIVSSYNTETVLRKMREAVV